MTKDEKIKALTTIVEFKGAGGQKEVMVEGKFKLLFKPNDTGAIVCNVSSNHHREWLYQFDWMVPYNADDLPKVKTLYKEIEEGIFEEIEQVVEPDAPLKIPLPVKVLTSQEIRAKRMEKMRQELQEKHTDI